MNRCFVLLLQVTFIILDLFVLNVAFYISQYFFAGEISEHFAVEYTNLGLSLNFCWIIAGFIGSVYNAREIRYFENFSRRTMHAFF
jgi:hypothetical protein